MLVFDEFPAVPPQTPLLDEVSGPQVLHQWSSDTLRRLADEVRAELLYQVGQHGGHLGAGLGVVELTIALHGWLNCPEDTLVFDVGHQAYPHKILTGRRHQLSTIRTQDGLAPFPCRSESDFDAFGTGHAGTAVSAALGRLIAQRMAGCRARACAVVGDGALSTGMTYEALAHAGGMGADLVVVLNDNGMSISPNTGALAERLPSAEAPLDGDIQGFFETLGFAYHGPVDGHDMDALVATLERLATPSGPVLLHVVTRKGAGFTRAEQDALSKGHAYQPGSGRGGGEQRYPDLFGRWAQRTTERDPRHAVITPAMREGAGLTDYARHFPERFFDVAIAEQHAVTLAAGMASAGGRPTLAIYATFLQRGMDQLIHDVVLQRLPVLFAIDRAGIVGEDGATHQGIFDIALLRAIPGLVIMTPADADEFERMLDSGHDYAGPCAVRYPRGGAAPGQADAAPVVVGKGRWLRRGQRLCLLNFGVLLPAVLEAAEALGASVIDMRFVAPLDASLVREAAQTHQWLATVEDHVISGGAGSAVAEIVAGLVGDHRPTVVRLGVPDAFVEHGSRQQQLARCGLDADGIRRQLEKVLGLA